MRSSVEIDLDSHFSNASFNIVGYNPTTSAVTKNSPLGIELMFLNLPIKSVESCIY